MLSGSSSSSTEISAEQLLDRFSSGTARQRRSLIRTIESRISDLVALQDDLLAPFDPTGDDWAAGWILQVLRRHQLELLTRLLPSEDRGWFRADSAVGIDYCPLQESLLREDFQSADRFTSAALRQLAGSEAERRGYVYFSEVPSMSGLDLVTLDRLWIAYSQGRFGFSAQARLLKGLNGRYDQLWPRIGWKLNGVWTRYPDAFTWSISAPEGHMPLVNQLRGVRLMDALLQHPSLKLRYGD